MSTDGLSSPGSSQYDSNSLYVGDGTWDANRNSFLLPNLVGFNLATTQYNGMGNRFRGLPGYRNLITAHGAIASIVFLLLVPTAILVVRFYQRKREGRSRKAERVHIWIQILVLFLLTVVLILGWFAVGPERSLTNPHHGIGVAIYTLIWIQIIGGAIVRRLEKYKDRDFVPIKLMLHHWFGRAIALLGLAQVPLGLALYGVARAFFIVYALIVAAWIGLYFILSYKYQLERYMWSDYAESYASGSTRPRRTEVIEETREESGGHFLRNTALVGGALAGLKALRNRRRRKDGEEVTEVVDEVVPSRPHSRQSRHSRHTSGSYVEDEKYTEQNQGGGNTWRNRLIGAGAGLAAFEGVRRFFGGRRDRDEESSVGSYSRPPLSGDGRVSRTDVSRVESGQAPFSPADRRRTDRVDRVDTTEYDSPLSSPTRPIRTPGRSRLRPRRSGSFSSVSSYDSAASPSAVRPASGDGGGGISKRQGLAATLAGISGLAYLRSKQKERRERREERRTEELRRYDEEIADRVNRTQRRRPGFGDSVVDETVEDEVGMTGSNPTLSRHSLPNTNVPPLPPSAAAPYSVTDDTYSNTTRPTTRPGYPMDDSSIPIPTGPGPSSDAQFHQSNASRVRFEDEVLPAAAAGGAAALAADEIAAEKARRRRRSSSLQRPAMTTTTTNIADSSTTSTGEPPVSVKVKIHDDNRHVTLRRLNEAEAAAEREARRRERRARRRPRTESLSSGIDSDVGPAGYRRRVRPSATAPIKNIPAPPPMMAGTSRVSSEQVVTPTGPPPPPIGTAGLSSKLPGPPPGPPPVPVHTSPYGASPVQVNPSPGYETGTGTGTEMSAFDDNRRRRRAERAAAKQRAMAQGQPVATGVRGDYT